MQRIRLLVLLLLCVVCQQTFAQQRTISGLVISAEDHEPLIGATISVQGNEAHGVVILSANRNVRAFQNEKFISQNEAYNLKHSLFHLNWSILS